MPTVKVNIILLGDGMAGKTTIMKKFSELLYLKYARQYEYFLQENGVLSYRDWMDWQRQEHLENEEELDLSYTSYFDWASWQYNLIKFDEWLRDLGVNLQSYMEKDTSVGTVGLDTIDLKFPHQHGAIHLTGYDLGGQNIYDQIREVITGLASPETFLVTVFDSSRLTSCEHSVRQLTTNLENIRKRQKGLPRIVIVFNKIDLKQHLKDPQWQTSAVNYLYSFLKRVRSTSITYSVPNLVIKGKMHTFTLSPDDFIGFEHLEALIYHSFCINESEFGQPPLTEDNAKAVARELAVQLLLLQHDDAEYYNRLSQEIFAMRPLAVQYLGGLAMVKDKSPASTTTESLMRLREKYRGFELDLRELTPSMVLKALKNSLKTEELETMIKEQGFPIFYTNALNGVGIMSLFNYLIAKGAELSPRASVSNALRSASRHSLRKLE